MKLTRFGQRATAFLNPHDGEPNSEKGVPKGGRITRAAAALALVAGVIAANAAFIGLGSSFDYPDILQEDTDRILTLFDDTRSTTMVWFAVLAFGAALLAPAAILLSRLGHGRAARWSSWTGVAAAVVQVVGLSRWFLLVPGLADRALDANASAAERADAASDFETANDLLGTAVGETLGYTLTALWTVLLIAAFPRSPTWFRAAGAFSALLIIGGVLVPLGVTGVDFANFLGYILWSLWLLVFAALILRGRV